MTASISQQGALRAGGGQKPLERTSEWTFPAGLVIVVLSLLSGFSTFLILTGLTPVSPTHNVVVTVLLVNIVLIAAMVAIVAWQVFDLWRARRRQAAGAGLHVRIVGLFSLVALFPAIFLAVFASVSLERVMDSLFSTKVKSIVQNSLDVATAYLKEHGQVIRAEMVGMAKELEEAAALLKEDRAAFEKFFVAQAVLRALPAAYLIDSKGQVLAEADSLKQTVYSPPPLAAVARANEGKVVTISPRATGSVAALKKLAYFENAYLYVIRPANENVIRHLYRTQANVADYTRLEQQRSNVQFVFAVMYTAIAFTLLLAAIWMGLWFANRLVAPIRKLIGAAQEVSQGNLNAQVEAEPKRGDLGQLGSTFNQMTADLRGQRNALIDANTMLDERRRFIEAVLSGVTAGVIGLDPGGVVTLANRSALDLLKTGENGLIGKPFDAAVPEFAPLIAKSHKQGKKPVQTQITIMRGGSERNFAVRVTKESEDRTEYGVVVTFDDISELVVAQRTSAWADVARRIAHEIKNPLTPIQLSAERIRRKYGASITTGREIFDRCIDTIIRHVGDIGRMVDEFSAFARMPKPVFEQNNVGESVREAVILFQMSHADIDYEIDIPETPLLAMCDRRLISQAVTNLVKNAGEGIAAAQISGQDYKGRITARVRAGVDRFVIEVIDNGCGLPKENRHRLVEPYVTTRQKGTGLGLAIVQRITEQHGGTLELGDAPCADGKSQGACVRISLPLNRTAEAAGKSALEPNEQSLQDNAPRERPLEREKEGIDYGV